MRQWQEHLQRSDGMAYDGRHNKLRKQDAVGMDLLVQQFIREMKIEAGLNRIRVREAWDAATGASRYTLDVWLSNKVLTCTISSSVVRNQLYFQKEALVQRINDLLEQDELFVHDSQKGPAITDIVLR